MVEFEGNHRGDRVQVTQGGKSENIWWKWSALTGAERSRGSAVEGGSGRAW